MNLVFVSNYMNHHQMPVSRELYRLCREQGGSYTFVQTQPMEQERVAMGWGESLAEADFVRNYWEDEIRCQESIDQADAVIFGGCEEESYIEHRLRTGKPLWRYSEPLYKTGRYKFVSPRGLRKKYHDHTRYRGGRVYLLCAGAYVAGDFRLVGAYGGKRFRYGYFPAFREQEPDTLMAGKDQVSQGQLRLLWAARMIDWKHPETALQVAAGLRERGVDFRLDMIGDGALFQEIREQAKALGLEEQVAFFGILQSGENPGIYGEGPYFPGHQRSPGGLGSRGQRGHEQRLRADCRKRHGSGALSGTPWGEWLSV